MFDCIVVGCGLCGMIIARKMAEKGKKVLIIEKREHIGGNTYDYIDDNGILVQKYGPHVFFTDNDKIKEFINSFVDTIPFYAEYRTMIDGKAIPMPFNFKSIDMIYDNEEAEVLKAKLKKEFGDKEIVSVVDLIDSNDTMIHEYGMYMYEHEYRIYTAKQWGRPIEEIDPSVFLRVPVYISYKKEYMKQKYQFLPKYGFTKLAEKILDHPNITVKLNRNALELIQLDEVNGNIYLDGKILDAPLVYTGPIDELFNEKYGKLPYRALEFVWKTLPVDSYMETALAAFPEADKFIRVTEYKKFPPQKLDGKTVIAIEYPLEYDKTMPSGNEPYYPTLTKESQEINNKYREYANNFKNLYICGRLGDFKYYNMDAVIERAFNVYNEILLNQNY